MTLQLALALPSLDGVGKIIVFLFALSVLVVLHEYGHFFVARRNGVRVNEFAVGMGPALYKWTSPRSGTSYAVNLFPIGGYCAMKGEDGRTNEAEQQRAFREPARVAALGGGGSVALAEPPVLPAVGTTTVHDEDNFQAKTPLQRLSIVVAGPVMNFLVAIVLLVFSYSVLGVPGDPTTTVGPVSPGMPAARAGMQAGDTIVAVDGRPIRDGNAMVYTIQHSLGKPLTITALRAGERLDFHLTPIAGPDGNGHTVGIIGFRKNFATKRDSLGGSIVRSGQEFQLVVGSTFGALGGLFTHPAQTAGQLHGVVGMASLAGEVQDAGWGPYFAYAALLSISLGIMNLLPFPALDGGRGIFILVEMLRGKPVDPEKEALVHVGGFAVLIALMLLVSYHDITQLVSGKGAL